MPTTPVADTNEAEKAVVVTSGAAQETESQKEEQEARANKKKYEQYASVLGAFSLSSQTTEANGTTEPASVQPPSVGAEPPKDNAEPTASQGDLFGQIPNYGIASIFATGKAADQVACALQQRAFANGKPVEQTGNSTSQTEPKKTEDGTDGQETSPVEPQREDALNRFLDTFGKILTDPIPPTTN